MRRRDLLKAAGFAAVADFDAIAERDDSGLEPDKTRSEGVLARLPQPSETPDERYELTLAHRLDPDILPDPDLFADADAHASLVSGRVTLTMGLGGVSSDEAVEVLERRGLRRSGDVDGRPLFVRRARYRQQVAAVDGETVIFGRGPGLEPVTSLVRTVAVPRSTTLEDRLPAVADAWGRLDEGAVLSVSPTRERMVGATGPRPIALGKGLSLRSPGGRLRTVAVYRSRAAREAAIDRSGGPPSVHDKRLIPDAPAIISERFVPEVDLQFLMETN